ncbi:MAG: bsaA [Bacteroidetes bacterium]|nr:bsaA [Bacteroidota bacterium]
MSQTIYDYSAKDLTGKEVNFSDYKGKVLLIVNTASECGYTPQYGTLEELYQMYKDRGFVVIGFPCGQFFQEPLEGEKIAAFCEKNYGVTFPMMEKANVIGFSKHPIYKFLSNKKLNGTVDSSPKWNFYKYLIDREGKVVDMYSSTVEPGDEALIKQIEKCLG